MAWTHFLDNCCGGTKEGSLEHIFIEAGVDEAKVIFYNRFGHSPSRVSCTFCGDDYSTSEYATLEEASAGQRGAEFVNGQDGPQQGVAYAWQNYVVLDDYVKHNDVLVIRANEVTAKERKGKLPQQGWIWCD